MKITSPNIVYDGEQTKNSTRQVVNDGYYFITAFKNTPQFTNSDWPSFAYCGDELNADMSSSFGGKPRSSERGGCHRHGEQVGRA
ncbi:MAG: hypothetical protein NTV24_04425, partial [Candidatus Woesebacteria bacterium]|nr:hypothetical protein [Candidatus Woesebacteria bacterium]